ncbi:uncharacterized protein PgNI_00182 [Pyricularia grisea]|uniref:Peptidase C1A papain C-terminal domain-containing protein n=1 Tax=Pyricularia grisea TaxID=148305 RepID=A0A6P8BKT4_PYRGI|nr:uncharacterized protein PgNI_00182 [Pyricularia grisea]TLD17299.1 hypothetical protein PgNI_00182 [Pyricularia grisea]
MSAFTITQPDGSSRTFVGYQYRPPREDCKEYTTAGTSNLDHLPHKVDLRRYMSPVESQGQTMSCVANAVAGAYEYLVKRHLGAHGYDVSRLFIYYNARLVNDPDGAETISDSGSNMEHAIDGLRQYGACSEETWPFDEAAVNHQPSQEAYDEAAGFVIEEAFRVKTDLDLWRTALADGHPIIFGVKTYGSFGQPRRGVVPVPTAAEEAKGDEEGSHGEHAMLCVGYSDPDQVFIVRNSWGEDWAAAGYCYMPYRYVMSERWNLEDSWVVERVDVLPPDEDCWAEDDETVLEEVSGVIADMSEDEYGNLVERMGPVPVEVRLALLFLRAAGADGQVAEEEMQGAVDHLAPVLEELGSKQNADAVLRNTHARFGDDDALVWDTVDVFREVFAPEVLASITAQLQDIIAADDEVSEEEQHFVDTVIDRWQVAPAAEEEEEEEGQVDDGEGDGDDQGEFDEQQHVETGEDDYDEHHYAHEEDVDRQ